MSDYFMILQTDIDRTKMKQRKGGEEGREQKPERVEHVKERHKTNKVLFSKRGACVIQMEAVLLH